MFITTLALLSAATLVASDQQPGCSCTDYVNSKGYGQCQKKFTKNVKNYFQKYGDRYTCYVNLPSTCTDLTESGTDQGKKLSAEACDLQGECPVGYELTTEYGSANKICGSQKFGSPGEVNMGGPNWPASSTPEDSRQACADACNNRVGCTHIMWFEDRGCRTQINCDAAVDGYSHTNSRICKHSAAPTTAAPTTAAPTTAAPTTAAPTTAAPTTTAPTPAPTGPPEGCFEIDTVSLFDPVHGNQHHIKKIFTAEDCQKECQKEVRCNFWQWNSPDVKRNKNTCWLKAKKQQVQPKKGKISGPRSCPGPILTPP